MPRNAPKPRVRRVSRVVRDIDPWSVFKVMIIFHFAVYLVVLIASVLLWNVAHATGTIDNVERFMESFGWETFTFNGGQLFHNLWVIGLLLVFSSPVSRFSEPRSSTSSPTWSAAYG